jgi:hypothetical protein
VNVSRLGFRGRSEARRQSLSRYSNHTERVQNLLDAKIELINCV